MTLPIASFTGPANGWAAAGGFVILMCLVALFAELQRRTAERRDTERRQAEGGGPSDRQPG